MIIPIMGMMILPTLQPSMMVPTNQPKVTIITGKPSVLWYTISRNDDIDGNDGNEPPGMMGMMPTLASTYQFRWKNEGPTVESCVVSPTTQK